MSEEPQEKKELSERLDNLVKELFKKANEDGIVTDEERAILDGVELTLKDFDHRLKLAYQSGLFTEDELEELADFRHAAVATAWHVASADQKLSEDEQELIKHLKKLLLTLANE